MKTTLFLAISLLVITMQVNAQSSIQPFDATIVFDKAQRPCIQVNIDPEPKTLKKALKDYLNENYNFKLKGIGFLNNEDLLSAEAITVNQISSNAMDFYTQIVEDENGSEMKLFVRYGYDIYITKEVYPQEYENLSELLEGFLKYYLPIYYDTEIGDTEKCIKKLSKETTKFKQNIDDNSNRIETLKNEIITLEEEVASNNKRLEIANTKLDKRKARLQGIKSQLKNL